MPRPYYTATLLDRELRQAREVLLAAIEDWNYDMALTAMRRLNELLGQWGRAAAEPSKL